VLDPADAPMGKWAEAIDHLHAAEALMAEMGIDAAPGMPSHNIAQVYRHYVSSAERAIQHHWRHAYFTIANRPAEGKITPDGRLFIEGVEAGMMCGCNCHAMGLGRPQDDPCGTCRRLHDR
jgi:hypothetical protein